MYEGKSPREIQKELARAPARARRRRISSKASKEDKKIASWYVVVDEILEGLVTLEAWPWPRVSRKTRFLSFDLDRMRRMTVDMPK
jgi:hypothetical protein